MKDRYVLVEWPESQEYMDNPDVVLCIDEDVAGPCAYFVPEEIYDEVEE